MVLDVEYNGAVIALSTGIAFIGAFAAVSLCEQYRLSTTTSSTRNQLILMAFVAFSLGGVGIWCMHYISTSSFRLTYEGVDVPVRYNIPMLIISLVVVCACEFAGLYCASTDNCFNKSKREIMEMFIARASHKYSMSEIKHMSKFKIITIVCTHSPERILVGGAIAGGGVAIMHYLGMMSMEFQGTVRYDPGLVVLSVIVAILAVIGGFWIFFRVLSLFPSLDILRVACALNGMFSLSGVHYIGLVSASYDYDANKARPEVANTIGADQMLIGVVAASVIFCAIMQVYVLSDLRGWLLRTSAQLRQAESVVNTIRKLPNEQRNSSTNSATARELYKYLGKYHQHTSETSTDMMSLALYNDYSEDEEESQKSNKSGGEQTATQINIMQKKGCGEGEKSEFKKPGALVKPSKSGGSARYLMHGSGSAKVLSSGDSEGELTTHLSGGAGGGSGSGAGCGAGASGVATADGTITETDTGLPKLKSELATAGSDELV